MRTVTARLITELVLDGAGWKILSLSVGPSRDLIVIIGETSYEDDRMRRLPRQVVYVWDWGHETFPVPGEPKGWLRVQPFGQGRWLFVGHWSEDGLLERREARVYETSGRFVRSLDVGPGVGHVQVTSDRRIWLGYIDEVIVGPRGAGTVAKAGLACLDEYGQILFKYNHHIAGMYGLGGESVWLDVASDVNAMNVVSDDEMWAQIYPSNALIRVVDSTVQPVAHPLSLRNLTPLRLLNAFAVGESVILCNIRRREEEQEYGEIYALSLQDGSMEYVQAIDELERRIHCDPYLYAGRGNRLYIAQGNRIYGIQAK